MKFEYACIKKIIEYSLSMISVFFFKLNKLKKCKKKNIK